MLVEQSKNNTSFGKSQHFTKIKINKVINEGKLVNCLITDLNDDILNAKLI